MNQTYPFYIKLSCILISIIILGFLAIIGQQILVPMVLGLLIAILLIPLCRFMETKLRFPRGLSSVLASVLALAIIGGVIYMMSMEVAKLANDWPQFQKQFIDLIDNLQGWISRTFGVRRHDQLEYLNDTLKKSISTGTAILEKTLTSVGYVLMLTGFTFLFTLFFLLYRTHLLKFLVASFTETYHKTVFEIVENIQFMVKKYLVGLFLQMIIVTILSFIAYTIIGVKYNFMLAILTGILNILPYIGIFTALLIGALITFATSGISHVLFIVIAIVVIHAIDGNIIMPRVVGSKVKINSLIVIIGLVVGEMLWGIAGMFLTIPVLAILKIIFDRVEGLQSWGFLMGEDDEVPVFKSTFDKYFYTKKAKVDKIIADSDNETQE
ncbi:MAG: AI-2E family transporter [Chryseobacterium sp. 36-9]|uniref:Predicted PurR-regulated permease PerM n=1 Tax=Epilithonimonas pallida TaxID=373671 RepID=A0ABY1R4V5_9FLAO|nr:AI-2E family transporter [Epilithonimonas pallida]OJX31977.1 MAG: AI-2E family transporter [Chryseobacterium sp. 36-9]SMP95633.1 Predicted PurR-regulated permease PerM [Epilithonimonas pallida]